MNTSRTDANGFEGEVEVRGVCEFHDEIVKKQKADESAIEGKVSKNSIKWIAAMFSMPIIAAILFAWAFMSSADYRYGSTGQAAANAANIKLIEERAIYLRGDLENLRTTMVSDLSQIKSDLKDISKELRMHSYSTGTK